MRSAAYKAQVKISILKLKRLNRRQSRQLSELTDSCNAYDGTHYGYPLDADAYYLLYEGGRLTAAAVLFLMGEHLNCKQLYELAAFTVPDKRRRAYYSRLLAAMKPRLKDGCIRYAVYENAAALAVLKKRDAIHSHDELILSLDLSETNRREKTAPSPALREAGGSDKESRCVDAKGDVDAAGNGNKAAAMMADNRAEDDLMITEDCIASASNSTSDELPYISGHAQNKFSECYFRIDKASGHAYIFGVQTYANYQRQGHAYRLLSSLYERLKAEHVKTVTLQVSSENAPALKLYEKLGMSKTQRLSLYTEQL